LDDFLEKMYPDGEISGNLVTLLGEQFLHFLLRFFLFRLIRESAAAVVSKNPSKEKRFLPALHVIILSPGRRSESRFQQGCQIFLKNVPNCHNKSQMSVKYYQWQ
jgi:hypothetical protein